MSEAVSAGSTNKQKGATDSSSFSFSADRSINSGRDLVRALKSAGKPASKSSGLEIKLKKSIARDIFVAAVKIDKISTFCAASTDTGKTGPQGNTISCSTIQASAEAAAAAISGAHESMAACTAGGTSSQDCLKSGVKTNFCS